MESAPSEIKFTPATLPDTGLCFRIEKSDLACFRWPDGQLSLPWYQKIKLTIFKKKPQQRQSDKTLEFICKARKVHGDAFDYSEIDQHGKHKKVTVVHRACGRRSYQQQDNHLSSSGCKFCANEKRGREKRLTTAKFIEKARTVHGDEFDYAKSDYKNANDHILITHRRCGQSFSQTPTGHLSGRGCKSCATKDRASSRRYNEQTFEEKARLVHGEEFDYSKVCYTRSQDHVTIIHRACGREFQQLPTSHLIGRGCRVCSTQKQADLKRYDTSWFISRARSTHGEEYDYSKADYKGANDKVTIIHRSCGLEFDQAAQAHLQGQGCRDCGRLKAYEVTRSNTESFVEKAKSIHGDAFDYSEVVYTRSSDTVVIVHRACGRDMLQRPSIHLKGGGCNKCAAKARVVPKIEKARAEFPEKARAVHSDAYDYSKVDYKRARDKVTIIHRACKSEFDQTPNSHLRGSGCPVCFLKSEYLARSTLEKLLGLPFVKARHAWLEGLELDGLCDKLKLAFEYQGQQHYEEVKVFHRDGKTLAIQQERDARKRRLCAEHCIALFEIPHTYSCAKPKEMEAFIRQWLEDHSYLKKTQQKITV